MNTAELLEILEDRYQKYNQTEFIEFDPISIPHLFENNKDREISGFLTATIAWGQRQTILKNANRLMALLDNAPYEFVMQADERNYKSLEKFCHRTFNSIDAVYFLKALSLIYQQKSSLEQIFTKGYLVNHSVFESIAGFREVFVSPDCPQRTGKHVSNVLKGASAKRINMFLRWMVRDDGRGVDFGIWKNIPSSALFIPLDLHTGNVARKLGLLKRTQNDWQAVDELTNCLRQFDNNDPVRFDFSLFGMGVVEGIK